MFGRNRQTPLLACRILHSLHGRIRIGCRALHHLHDQAEELAERLVERPGLQSARVSTTTGNVVLYFDPALTSCHQTLEVVEGMVGQYAREAYMGERLQLTQVTVQERRLQEESVLELVTRVAATGVGLLFSALKARGAPPPATFLRRFTTVPALTTLSLAGSIVKSGLGSLARTKRPNADTLSATAILTSLLAGRDLSALTIIWLADIAELLTAYTMERTRNAIRDMLAVGGEFVWRLGDDATETKVALNDLRVGDRVLANTGEKSSVDGAVESGEAAVDQASITGEFLPMRKVAGEPVFAGTVVKSGGLIIRAQRVGDQTAVARIIHLVEEATHRKADIQAFADRFSAQFIPVNFALAVVVYAVTRSSGRALNMLIIDYSCGVRLSTATAFSAAICAAARNGLLVKGGNYLELLAEADTLILDKTGTLTEGRPHVASLVAIDGADPRDVVEAAAAAEETSTHPMALAVLDKVRREGWLIPQHADTRIHVARGVETRVGRSQVRVGSRVFMEETGIDLALARDEVSRLVRRGENIVYVARGKKLLGLLGIQDALRENMKKALNRLRQSGIDDSILLTGDVEQHAEIVASRMAMDRYEAEVLPEGKADTVLQLQAKGVRVV